MLGIGWESEKPVSGIKGALLEDGKSGGHRK